MPGESDLDDDRADGEPEALDQEGDDSMVVDQTLEAHRKMAVEEAALRLLLFLRGQESQRRSTGLVEQVGHLPQQGQRQPVLFEDIANDSHVSGHFRPAAC